MEGNSASRSLGIDTLFQYASTIIQMLSGFIFYGIAARLFSSAVIGTIALFIAILGLFNIIFTFGLQAAAPHFISFNIGDKESSQVKKTSIRIISYGFILSTVGLFVLFLLSGVISTIFLHSMYYTQLIKILSTVLFGYVIFTILNGVLLGLQKFRLSAVINIIVWSTFYMGSILFAILHSSLYAILSGWIVSIFAGVIIDLIASLLILRGFKENGNAPLGKDVFKYSFPVFLSALISYGASYADRFIVAGLLDISSLGVYNFALLISSAMGFIFTPIGNILLSKFSELYGKGLKSEISENVKMSITLVTSIYVPAAIGVSALSPMILTLIGGTTTIKDVIPLTIILSLSALLISRTIMVQTIAAIRRTRIFIYSSLASLISNAVLSIILIPRMGLIGASIGLSSVSATNFLVLSYFALKEKVLSFDFGASLKIWISAVAMFSVVMVIMHFAGENLTLLPIYIMLGAVVYIVLLRNLKLFRSKEKELILSFFPEENIRLKKLLLLFLLH